MSFNRVPEFPQMYLQYLDQARRQTNLGAFQLGGTGGGGGGSGIPPGGFIGQLIQTRVTYDTSEAASTSGSSSLLDNLNHIRSRLGDLELGGGSGNLTGGGVAGRVAFWTAGSTVSSDSDFTWNSTTNRLGIGSLVQTSGSMSLAGSTLTLDGSMRFDPTGATAGSFLTYDGAKWTVGAGGGSGTITGFGVADQLAYWTSGSAISSTANLAWSTSGSALVLGGGTYVSSIGGSLQIIRQAARAGLSAITYSSTPSNSSFLTMAHAQGSAASPSATQLSDTLLQINALGHYGGGASNWSTAVARIEAVATESFTSGSWGSKLNFSVVETGTDDLFPTLQVQYSGLTTTLATAGASGSINLIHLDSSSILSHAYLNAIVGGPGGGDPALGLSVSGVTDWTAGIDNSDGDKFKIGASSAVGTNTALTLFTTALDTIGIGTKTFKLSNSMEIDPSGATVGLFLGYDGSKWVPATATGGSTGLGVTGAGVAGRVAYWSGASTLTSDADMTFDGTSLSLAGHLNFANDKGLVFAASGTGGGIFRYNTSNTLAFVNQAIGPAAGDGISFGITTSASAGTSMTWDEDGDLINRTKLLLSSGSKGARFYMVGTSGAVDITTTGGSGGTDLASFPGQINGAKLQITAGSIMMASRALAIDASIWFDPAGATSGQFLGYNGSKWVPTTGSSSGGNVATDVIWDALGDLAVGTGANTAIRLAAGADGTVLESRSTEPSGLKWITAPAGAVDIIQTQVYT